MRYICLAYLIILLNLINLNYGQTDLEWQEFKQSFNKTYKNSTEESLRKQIWKDNLNKIKDYNSTATKDSYNLKINQFGDLTQAEFNNIYNKFKINTRTGRVGRRFGRVLNVSNSTNTSQLPKYVNWTQLGYVSSVKEQKACGSCWAFSAAGALESKLHVLLILD
jgi:C1A family cysteine protease